MKILLTIFATVLCLTVAAQQKHTYPTADPAQWVIPKNDTVSYKIGDYMGQKALLMSRRVRNYKAGIVAYLKNLVFKDGTIEADIAWPQDKGGYVGLAFRIRDPHHYECIYFRPESSGTVNAIQYMPEKKADFNWWDYEADKYQAIATLPLHDWFHIKLIVKGKTLTVFVNNQPKPAMVYKALDNSLPVGSVGYWFGNSAGGAFRNLVVSN